MLVNTSVAPPHSLLVVDATLDAKGFEYSMTDSVVALLLSKAVTLRTPNPLKPRSLSAFLSVIPANAGFSSLLLVAHGTPWANDDVGAYVRICGELVPWAFLGSADLKTEDRLVTLAICHGLNASSGEALIRTQNQALMVVGPTNVLTRSEVTAFIPAFYASMFAQGHCSWCPGFVQDTLAEHNHKAAGKMALRSYV